MTSQFPGQKLVSTTCKQSDRCMTNIQHDDTTPPFIGDEEVRKSTRRRLLRRTRLTTRDSPGRTTHLVGAHRITTPYIMRVAQGGHIHSMRGHFEQRAELARKHALAMSTRTYIPRMRQSPHALPQLTPHLPHKRTTMGAAIGMLSTRNSCSKARSCPTRSYRTRASGLKNER